MRRRAALALGLLVLSGPLAGAASARSLKTFSYPLDEVYSAALRLVRVDRGCSVTDRDPQAAYLLFECKEDKKLKRGALELVRSDSGVRAQLNLLDEPSYLEIRLLELLERKLRDEQGPPRPPPRPAPPPPSVHPSPPDGGAR